MMTSQPSPSRPHAAHEHGDPGIAKNAPGTVPYKRKVGVYVPRQYEAGTPAPFIVARDGLGYAGTLPKVLDNLIHEKRVPVMIAIMINSGGGDAQGMYAATDNIIADWRCTANGREHMLGDEFKSSESPAFRLKLHGTGRFSKVTIIKDDAEASVTQPNQAEVELTWTDPKPTAGKASYYYVRGEQADGELVWVSPMWVTYEPGK